MRDTTLIIIIFLGTLLLVISIIEFIIIRNAINEKGEISITKPEAWDFNKILSGLRLAYDGMAG